jgi:hypothetical protein
MKKIYYITAVMFIIAAIANIIVVAIKGHVSLFTGISGWACAIVYCINSILYLNILRNNDSN